MTNSRKELYRAQYKTWRLQVRSFTMYKVLKKSNVFLDHRFPLYMYIVWIIEVKWCENWRQLFRHSIRCGIGLFYFMIILWQTSRKELANSVDHKSWLTVIHKVWGNQVILDQWTIISLVISFGILRSNMKQELKTTFRHSMKCGGISLFSWSFYDKQVEMSFIEHNA